jgi:hypothetical protein
VRKSCAAVVKVEVAELQMKMFKADQWTQVALVLALVIPRVHYAYGEDTNMAGAVQDQAEQIEYLRSLPLAEQEAAAKKLDAENKKRQKIQTGNAINDDLIQKTNNYNKETDSLQQIIAKTNGALASQINERLGTTQSNADKVASLVSKPVGQIAPGLMSQWSAQQPKECSNGVNLQGVLGQLPQLDSVSSETNGRLQEVYSRLEKKHQKALVEASDAFETEQDKLIGKINKGEKLAALPPELYKNPELVKAYLDKIAKTAKDKMVARAQVLKKTQADAVKALAKLEAGDKEVAQIADAQAEAFRQSAGPISMALMQSTAKLVSNCQTNQEKATKELQRAEGYSQPLALYTENGPANLSKWQAQARAINCPNDAQMRAAQVMGQLNAEADKIAAQRKNPIQLMTAIKKAQQTAASSLASLGQPVANLMDSCKAGSDILTAYFGDTEFQKVIKGVSSQAAAGQGGGFQDPNAQAFQPQPRGQHQQSGLNLNPPGHI